MHNFTGAGLTGKKLLCSTGRGRGMDAKKDGWWGGSEKRGRRKGKGIDIEGEEVFAPCV